MNSGIYIITNKIDGKKYIGQAVDFNKRFASHKFRSNTGNEYLYRAMRYHGFDNFKFEKLIICDMEYSNYIEPLLIKTYNTLAPNGYNSLEGGKNARHNETTKQTISESRMGKGLWKNDPNRVKGMQGKTQSAKQKDAVTKANSNIWRITTPTGEKITITNLNEYARQNGLAQSNLSRGGHGSHKGYRATRLSGIDRTS